MKFRVKLSEILLMRWLLNVVGPKVLISINILEDYSGKILET